MDAGARLRARAAWMVIATVFIACPAAAFEPPTQVAIPGDKSLAAGAGIARPYRENRWKPLIVANQAAVKQKNETMPGKDDGLTKEQKALVLNAAAVTAIATYGLIKWDYFQTSPKSTPEGWLGRTTKSGGADKLGHLWISYAASDLLAYTYRRWGYSDSAANSLGALSALGIVTLMELGDAYSGDFGFSYEDMVMNMAGAGTAYVLGRYPSLKRKIDLRVEFKPDSFGDLADDVFTDYENQRYLLSLKLDGFDVFNDSYLGYLELHFGYFARGYDTFRSGGGDARRRSVYFGIGFNVSKLVQKYANLAVFDYIQLPFVSARTSKGLD